MAAGSSVELSNLTHLVSRHARDRGDAEALVQAGPDRRALTWSELDTRIDAVAAGYAERGLRAGHRLGLAAPGTVDFVVCHLAALRAGLVVVPFDPDVGAAELDSVSDELGIKVVLGTDVPLDLDDLAGATGAPVASPPDAQAPALLLSSPGTGRWAIHHHRSLLAPLAALDPRTDRIGSLGAVTIGCELPLFHVFALTAVLGGWLASGARLVLAEPYADRLAAAIAAESVDVLPVTPALLLRLLRTEPDALGSLRYVLAGGAAVPEWLTAEVTARTGLRVDHGYGLTETAAGVSSTFGGPVLGPTHVGRALPGVELRIGDASDQESTPESSGEPGLISIRAANLFAGYWPDGDGGPDADGWFVTDDVGYLRDDELFLLDRSREVVTVQGFPVYPAEVEQVLRELPAVTGAAAVGVPDERRGMRIVAYVTGEVSLEELQQHCRRLAPYKRPTEFHLADELPLGVLGEVHRGAVRQLSTVAR